MNENQNEFIYRSYDDCGKQTDLIEFKSNDFESAKSVIAVMYGIDQDNWSDLMDNEAHPFIQSLSGEHSIECLSM